MKFFFTSSNNQEAIAARKKYEAQIEEALATLHIYFTNSVGNFRKCCLRVEGKYIE